MKESIMVDVFVRPAPRAALDCRLGWYAKVDSARAWTIIAQVRALLAKIREGGFDAHGVSYEEGARHEAGGSEGDGNLRPVQDGSLGSRKE